MTNLDLLLSIILLNSTWELFARLVTAIGGI